jgi:transglutaminase-like putative cysteine protease
VVWFSLRGRHDSLTVHAIAAVERTLLALPADSPAWEIAVAALAAPAEADTVAAREFCLESPYVEWGEAYADYARPCFAPGRPLLEAVAALCTCLHADFEYRPNATQIGTPLSQVLAHRHGVCQDFAHLALAALRSLGLAARYVSGYLETIPPPGVPLQVGADASHAWIGVYIPSHGWVDFDPTNGISAGVGHLTLGWGRDYGDVAPLNGVIFGGGRHTLKIGVTVRRVAEAG